MKHRACFLSVGMLAMLGGGGLIVSTAEAQSRFGNAPLGTPLGNLQYQTQGNPTYGPSSSNGAYNGMGPGGFPGSQSGAFDMGGFNRGLGTTGQAYRGPSYFGLYPPIYYGPNNYAPGSNDGLGGGLSGEPQQPQEGAPENGGFNGGQPASGGVYSPPINYGNFAPNTYASNYDAPGSSAARYGYNLPSQLNAPSGAQGRFQYDWW